MGGLKCKMCGSNLDIGDSITVCKCEKCGTSQTVPDIEDDKELKLFERAGRLRFKVPDISLRWFIMVLNMRIMRVGKRYLFVTESLMIV